MNNTLIDENEYPIEFGATYEQAYGNNNLDFEGC